MKLLIFGEHFLHSTSRYAQDLILTGSALRDYASGNSGA